MSMTVDFSDFEKGFKYMTNKISRKEVGKALFEAGGELLRDAKEIKPKVPRDDGALSRSGRVNKAEVKHGEASCVVGFNKEYAARWHELTPAEDRKINWTTPGSGRKYLESKMIILKEKYMGMVADYINEVLRRG
jgi:hypothetical protein